MVAGPTRELLDRLGVESLPPIQEFRPRDVSATLPMYAPDRDITLQWYRFMQHLDRFTRSANFEPYREIWKQLVGEGATLEKETLDCRAAGIALMRFSAACQGKSFQLGKSPDEWPDFHRRPSFDYCLRALKEEAPKEMLAVFLMCLGQELCSFNYFGQTQRLAQGQVLPYRYGDLDAVIQRLGKVIWGSDSPASDVTQLTRELRESLLTMLVSGLAPATVEAICRETIADYLTKTAQ